jgi:hypothetical protein
MANMINAPNQRGMGYYPSATHFRARFDHGSNDHQSLGLYTFSFAVNFSAAPSE